MRNFVLISDFYLKSNNRGTAALGYGSLSFLIEKGFMSENHVVVQMFIHLNPFRKSFYSNQMIQGRRVCFYNLHTSIFEYYLLMKIGIIIPFLPLGNMVKNLALVAAINGGDGLSDIYGEKLFKSRLSYSYLAIKRKIPLVILPQTIGPFEHEVNKKEVDDILSYASAVFVRDNMYVKELDRIGVKYELTKDLSAYMKSEAWDIEIKPGAIGINVSGLAYSNKFLNLAGEFSAYPLLIYRIIKLFQHKGKIVYLIPHAYNYNIPEENNDDLVACKAAFEKLEDKTNVVLIDIDLKSPYVKYIISKMSFFCGTRMHANFAAIYTNVPVFGLAYSYKYAGAFEANGLAADQTYLINNLDELKIDEVIKKIDDFYINNCKQNSDI